MLFKMHSYLAVNGEMADEYHRMKRLEVMIQERVAEVEGDENEQEKMVAGSSGVTEQAWQRAVKRAKEAAEASKKAKDDGVEQEEERVVDEASRNSGEKDAKKLDQWNSLPAQRGTSILRQRANASIIEKRSLTSKPLEGTPATSSSNESVQQVIIRDPHPLATHPDSLISELAREVESIREDLTSSPDPNITTSEEGDQQETFTKTVTWPENITVWNFWDYLLVPTLVYELSYPRTKAIRPLYVLEKVLATFGTFFVIYVITEHWIMPKQPDPSTPILRTFLELAVPMMINVSDTARPFLLLR
jgi:sterol O-acyltransferase